jgi:hypothetical protein
MIGWSLIPATILPDNKAITLIACKDHHSDLPPKSALVKAKG